MNIRMPGILMLLSASLLIQALVVGPAGANEFASNHDLVVSAENPGSGSELTISIRNDSNESVTFLSWGTPFESEILADVFDLSTTVKGLPLENRANYIGYQVRRGEPDAGAYITLEPGSSLTRTIDLAGSYAVDRAASYTVSYKQDLLLIDAVSGTADSRRSVLTSLDAESPDLQKTAAKKVVAVSATTDVTMHPLPRNTPRVIPPAYTGCSAVQQSNIETTLSTSESLLDEVFGQISGFSSDQLNQSPRYRSWFGAYQESRHDTVMRIFSNLANAFDDQLMTFDCRCIIDNRENTFAFVRRDMPWHVNVCPLYFAQESEQVVTLVHELTHFNEIGPVFDHRYGVQPSQLLALNDPDLAVNNADSYGYFVANNNPVLSLEPEEVEDDSAPATPEFDFQELAAGQTVTGEVEERGVMAFIISGATEFQLETLEGDADLYIYTDAGIENEICASFNPPEDEDVCVVGTPRTLFVLVYGFHAASFELSTIGFNPENALVTLVAGESVSGSVAESESRLYVVSGAESITLESLTGDADLYLFESEFLDANSLLCESFLTTTEAPVDTCPVPDVTRVFIRVYGYEDSDFNLSTTTRDAQQGDDFQITTLRPGETFDGFVAEDDFAVFAFNGSGRLDLVSESGDADLYIYDDPEYFYEVCFSEQPSEVSTLDSCELEGGFYDAIVYGYMATDFSLTFTRDEDIPVNVATNPEITPSVEDTGISADVSSLTGSVGFGGSGGSGGGGGATGGLLLVLMLVFRLARFFSTSMHTFFYGLTITYHQRR